MKVVADFPVLTHYPGVQTDLEAVVDAMCEFVPVESIKVVWEVVAHPLCVPLMTQNDSGVGAAMTKDSDYDILLMRSTFFSLPSPSFSL